MARRAVANRSPTRRRASRQRGRRALKAIPFETPLYARVDLIRDQKGEPVVLELELIEPSLFFPFDVRSAERFAAAVVRKAKGSTA